MESNKYHMETSNIFKQLFYIFWREHGMLFDLEEAGMLVTIIYVLARVIYAFLAVDVEVEHG